jgi:hypothetical protein
MVRGVLGHPIFDLEPFLDLGPLEAIHDEACIGLAKIKDVEYTGGSHRSMGIMPDARAAEALVDYGEIMAEMSDDEFMVLGALGDNPSLWDPQKRGEFTYGEERDLLLNRVQMRWLEVRYGVYFPWKTYAELMPGGRWDDKANPKGKAFTREAQLLFPKTIAYIKSLPFSSIGSVKLLGVSPNDHGTVHRDRDGKKAEHVDHFVTLCPKKNKRLFVYDADTNETHEASTRAYWFNDADYHGVAADPFFRYSIRIDGTFKPEFLDELSSRKR